VSIRVFIVDDHPVVRDGLRFAIERSGPDLEVVGEAADGLEAIALADQAHADVYVMDVTMPRLNGIETTRELTRMAPAARVVTLSLNDSDAIVREAFVAGARGFLTKESATRHVVDAIREVHAGRYYVSPAISRSLVEPLLARSLAPDGTGARGPDPALTPRERRVLQRIAEGRSNKDIASELDLSVNTVLTHRRHLMRKLDIHNQAELVRYALREGIARP
jgi:DNA-binding NarL/FixJ family response regulator